MQQIQNVLINCQQSKHARNVSDQSYKYLALFLKAESFCPGKKLTSSHAPATTQNAVLRIGCSEKGG